MNSQKEVSLSKGVVFSFVITFFLLSTIGTGTLGAQSIASETSNSSCNAGGEIWVCGPSQLALAHGDFNRNCSEWEYRCGQTLKTIKDVCSPQIVTSTITSKAC